MSSVVSSRSKRANARLFTIMDSIFAIAFGLGLRFVVDTVSHHDFKLTGTLIGLWEGVITLHFVKKMPSSFDPYVAYGVRMFVDFLVTESLSRLILVVVWTGLGMVLADITPAIWADVGLHRIWRRFRRDLYTMSSYIPKVAFFPKARIVRFSPSRPPSVLEPSVITSAANAPATSAPPRTRRRHVPGDFPDFISETDTDLGSILGRRPATTLDTSSVPRTRTAHYRYSGMPIIPRSDDGSTDISSPSTQNDDLDDGNLSSSDSSATETEPVDPSLFNPSEIPDEEHAAAAQEVVIVSASPDAAVAAEDQTTPKQKYVPFPFPPTPSDSAARFDLRIQPNQRDLEPDLPVPPHTAGLEQIPDLSDDWENIETEEAIMSSDERPPTPPAKDDLPAAYRDKGKYRFEVEQPSASTSTSTLTSRDLAREWGVPNPNTQPVAATPIESTLLLSTFLSSPLVPPTGDLISLENSDPSPPYDDDLYVVDDFTHNDNPNLNAAAGPSHLSASGYMNEKGANNETLTMNTDTTDDSAADEDARGEPSTVVVDHEAELRRMEEETQRKWDEQEQREKEEWERKQREEARLAEEEKRKAEEEKQRAEAQREEEEKKWRAEEEGRIAEEQRQRVEAQREEDEKKKKAEEARIAEEERQRVEAQREEDEKKKKAEDEKRKEEQEKLRLAKAEEEKKKREASNERRRKLSEKKRLENEAKENQRLEEQAKEVAKRLEDEAKKQKEEEQRLADEKKRAEDVEKEKQRPADEQSQAAARETLVSGTTGEQNEEQTQQAGGADPETVHTPKQQTVPFSTSQEPSAEDDVAESVITEASMAPEDAKERLKQAIILRAQMFETEKAIESLKDQADKEDELKRAEKTLRKMEKKAKRRYDSVFPAFKQDELSLDPLGPKEAERMLEATLEALITPESKALSLDIILGKARVGNKQKPNITKVLDDFQLFPYTTTDSKNGKLLHVTVSDTDYSKWVATYRQAASREEDGDADDDVNALWRG